MQNMHLFWRHACFHPPGPHTQHQYQQRQCPAESLTVSTTSKLLGQAGGKDLASAGLYKAPPKWGKRPHLASLGWRAKGPAMTCESQRESHETQEIITKAASMAMPWPIWPGGCSFQLRRLQLVVLPPWSHGKPKWKHQRMTRTGTPRQPHNKRDDNHN